MKVKTLNDLEALVSQNASESQSLEFKAGLPGKADKDKFEFLKDIASFANSGGGTIIYGVSEKNGQASKLTPFEVMNLDEEKRRLLQISDSGIEPRLPNVSLEWTESLDGKHFLILEIGRSYTTPHRVVFGGHSKFPLRNQTHTVEQSYGQLRDAFRGNQYLIDQLDSIWFSWIERSINGKTFRPLNDGPFLVCGILPVESASRQSNIDLEYAFSHQTRLIGQGWGGCSANYNYEGLAVFAGYSETSLGHMTQISRFGEVIDLEQIGHEYKGDNIIPSVLLSQRILERTKAIYTFWEYLLQGGPVILRAALCRIGDYGFINKDRYGFQAVTHTPHQILEFPPIWIEDNNPFNNGNFNIIRSWMDLLWQTMGYSNCSFLDEHGAWAKK